MTVHVQFFANLCDAAGMSESEAHLPEGASVADLLDVLYGQHPKLRAWDSNILVGVGVEFVERGETGVVVGPVLQDQARNHGLAGVGETEQRSHGQVAPAGEVRGWVLREDVTSSPIVMREGRLFASGWRLKS